jgi:hypothetical protein
MRVSKDGIQRSPEFVREHCEELVLQPTRPLDLYSCTLLTQQESCALFCNLRAFLLCLLPLGDIGADANHPLWPSLRVT